MSSTASTSSSGPTGSRSDPSETTRFRCCCGRSVAAPEGSEAATTGRCSRCRSRQRDEVPLHRTT